MATLDRAEQLEERFAMAVTQQGVQAVMKIEEAGLRWSVRTARDLPGTTAQALGDFADRIREDAEARRERAHEREFGSEVDLKEFSELGGKREVVDIEDDEVLEGVRQELRKHGVTFAVERDDEGNHYLHVRGSDADLIAHALNRVQESLDRERARTPQQEPDTPSEPTPERSPEFQKAHQEAHAYALYVAEQVSDGQSIELTDEQIEQLTTDALRERGFTPDGARIESPEQPTPDRGSRTGETPTREPRFTTTSFQGEGWESHTVDKAVALGILDKIPADAEIPGRGLTEDMLSPLKDAQGWIGTDPDVDRAIAEKFPDLMTPEQLAVTRAHDGPTPGQADALAGRDNSAEEAELARREEAYLNARKATPDPLPEGYESAPTADLHGEPKALGPYDPNLSPAESRERGQEIEDARAWALDNDRDALRAYEYGEMGSEHPADSWKHENTLLSKYRGAVAEGYRPSATPVEPKLTTSREQSKSLIREKIGALVNRISGTSGPNALTQKHGLDAHHHPKGPKR